MAFVNGGAGDDTQPIPTLSVWALLALMLGTLSLGLMVLRHRPHR